MSDAVDLVGQLRRTLGKMESALGTISEAIAWTDEREGKIQWCNEAFCRLVGRRYIEVLGQSMVDLLPLYQEGRLLESKEHPLNRSVRQGSALRGDYEFQMPTGRLALQVSVSRAELGGGQTSEVLVIWDITERKQVEEELKKEREQLKRLNEIMMTREERILELKREINQLLQELNRPARFNL